MKGLKCNLFLLGMVMVLVGLINGKALTVSAVEDDGTGTQKNGLVLEDGIYRFFVENELNTEYEGLYLHNGSWFVIKDGKVDTSVVGML